MRDVARVVEVVAHDDAALRFLRHDPDALARELGLPGTHVEAMRSADRFFASEQPILDRPQQQLRAETRPATAALFVPVMPAPVAVSTDTGTLLPGPDTGSFTATASVTATAPPATPPRGPAAPSPNVPRAPLSPPPVVPRAPTAPSPAAPFPPM